jgi:glycosyltransferase involved in cell wall biosynthesis
MIFIANVLEMNGGTTFLVRVSRELAKRGIPTAVIVMFPIVNPALQSELSKYATIINLKDFGWDKGVLLKYQLITFAPLDWKRLMNVLSPFGNVVHVMGVFGMIFAARLATYQHGLRITAGVYHQNEFLFKAKNSYFIDSTYNLFRTLPTQNLLFFNQVTFVHYADFFKRDFSKSVLAPIGIDLPKDVPEIEPTPYRIVSVGNLLNFKTYNRHVIHTVAELVSDFPGIHYHIYGVGEEEPSLRKLTNELNIEDRIIFKGLLPYEDFINTVKSASLFVGSGTALLEAASLGIPSLVGIESIQEPKTYGFISDVEDLSYNEFIPGRKLVEIRELTKKLFSDKYFSQKISSECKVKSKEFSVEVTVDQIDFLNSGAVECGCKITKIQSFMLFVSFCKLALSELVDSSNSFRNRRNQSFEISNEIIND